MAQSQQQDGKGVSKSVSPEEHTATRRAQKARQQAHRKSSQTGSSTAPSVNTQINLEARRLRAEAMFDKASTMELGATQLTLVTAMITTQLRLTKAQRMVDGTEVSEVSAVFRIVRTSLGEEAYDKVVKDFQKAKDIFWKLSRDLTHGKFAAQLHQEQAAAAQSSFEELTQNLGSLLPEGFTVS